MAKRRTSSITKKLEKELLKAASNKELVKEFIDNRPIQVTLLPRRHGGGRGKGGRRGRGGRGRK